MTDSVTDSVTPRPGAVGWFRAVVVDAEDPETLAAFWMALLGVEVAEREQDWIQLTRDAGGVYLAFQPLTVDGDHPTTRPRPLWMRPDIEVTDLDRARSRIVELGGRLVREVHEPSGDTHLVMADPEGNEFCILPPLPPELAR